MVSDSSVKPRNSSGNKRGLHPNSLKNLEKGRQFGKGQKSNPNGRPKKDVSITSIVKELLLRDAGNGKTYADLVAEVIVDGIIDEAGNLKHGVNVSLIRELLDRVEGKVALPITGGQGEPLIAKTMQLFLADGTVIKPPRNGHEA